MILAPLVDSTSSDDTRSRILEVLQESRFNKNRVGVAITMLRHVDEFLGQKGHKIMQIRVRETLKSLEERRRDE